MRSGIETSALTKHTTGTSRYITCLLEQLKNLEDEVITFSSFDLNINSPLNHKGLEKFIYRNFYLKKEMQEKKIDYAFFPDYFMPSSLNLPAAIVIHDLSFLSHPHFYSKAFIKFYEYQLRKTLENNPLILAVSENTKESIIKHLQIHGDKIYLHQGYSDFNDNFKKDNFIKTQDEYLLYVGHIEPRKNLHFLIKTFLKWKEKSESNLKLILAGEIWLKSAEIKKIFSEFKNHNSVNFVGYVDEQKLKELYRNASGFVHTSFVEGFCFPVLEAMHYNLPVICSARTGAEEISKPLSITINPLDEKSLLEGFNMLEENISSQSKINYEIKYSPNLMRSQLEKIVEILKDKANRKTIINISSAVSKEEAVEKTLLYSAIFNSGMDKEKLYKSLFDIKLNRDEFERTLLKLYLENKIFYKNEIIFLSNYAYAENVNREVNSANNKKALRLIKLIPFISSVSLSGGTAHYGIESHNDLDLFIITRKNSLYIVYAVIHLLSLLLKIRKELCANYLIDESHLEITHTRDFYTAHQIISLKPIKNEVKLNQFFNANKWINNFFPNFSRNENSSASSYDLFILIPLNKILKFFYRFLYRRKIISNQDSIILNDFTIKLHTNDNRQKITKEFLKTWENYKENISSEVNRNYEKKIAVR